jgi:hypothetical protein
MKWNDSSYACIERRARNIHMYPPLWDGVCAISAHAVERALHGTCPALHDMGVPVKRLITENGVKYLMADNPDFWTDEDWRG